MLSVLFHPASRPFTVALVVMLGIGLVEVVALLAGGDLFAFLDDALDVDLDAGADGVSAVEGAGPFTRFLGWMQVGRVPVLMLLVLFLLAFGLAGLFVQASVASLLGGPLPAWIAAPAVAVAVLPGVRGAGVLLARVMPKDETESVPVDSFVGRIAVVTLGTATRGTPAQAKLKDRFGHSHYVLVEPDVDGEAFPQGAAVLLVSRAGAVFRAIKNPSPSLLG